MKKFRIFGAILAAMAMFFSACPPAISDVGFLTITGNPLTSPNAPYLILSGLNSQSACSVSFNGTVSGTYAVEGIYAASQNWTQALTVVAPDGTNPATSISAAGNYAFNCANMVAVRVDGSSGGGAPTVTINASGAVGRVLSNGVNGGRTNVVGSGPITVSNSGNTATVGLTSPLAITYGGTNNTTFTTGQAITYNGTSLVSTPFPVPPTVTITSGPGIAATTVGTTTTISNTGAITVAPGANVTVATSSPGIYTVSAATATPVVVQGGANISVATPSPGVFVVSAATATPNPSLTSGPGITTTNNYSHYTYPFTVSGTSTSGDVIQLNTTIPMPAGCGNFNVINYFLPSTGLNPTQIASGWAADINAVVTTCVTAASVGPVMTVTTTANYGTMSVAFSGTGSETVTPTAQPGTGSGTYTQTTIANSGALQVTSGSSNVTVTTPSPGVYQVAVATPTPFAGVTSVSGTGNIASTGGTTPVISITNAPTFANVTDSALTSGQCVQASTSGLLTTTGSSCGSGTGTVTSVTGTSPILSSGGTTPAISCATCVTGLTAGSNIVTGTGTTPSVAVTAAPTFTNVTDSALTSGNCVQAMASGLLSTVSSACGSVTGLTAGSNVIVGTGSTPSVAVTAAPTFANVTDSALTSGNCVQASTSGILTTASTACNVATTTVTTSSVVIPAVGSTVSVPVSTSTIPLYSTLVITDGTTNAFAGTVTAGGSTSTLTVTNNQIIAGTAGNTIASGSSVRSGSATGQVASLGAGSNVVIAGTATVPTVAVTAAPSFTSLSLTNPLPVTSGGTGVSSLTNGRCLRYASGYNTSTLDCPATTTNATFVVPSVGTSVTVSLALGAFPQNNELIQISDGTHSILGQITAGGGTQSLTVTNIGLVSGSVGNTMASGAAVLPGGGQVGSIAAGTNISVNSSVAYNPTISTSLTPSFTSVTATGLNAGDCMKVNTGGLMANVTNACAGTTTNGGFTIPAVGSTVAVNLLNAFASNNGLPISISDNTNSMSGIVTAGAGSTSITVRNIGLESGAVGNTMASGASAYAGGGVSRVELNMALGFAAGAVSTATTYPYQQVPAYNFAQITSLRAACGTADNGSTVFTVTDVTSSTTIGTVTMASSATTATATLGTPYTLTTGHVINMVVTTAGTATNCGVTADGIQTTY